ncbi:MAG: hypothetical protein P8176_16530 [Gammaproteobacteria bacterium]
MIGSSEEWLEARCHDLKHKQGVRRILGELKASTEQRFSKVLKELREKREAAVSYFKNNLKADRHDISCPSQTLLARLDLWLWKRRVR